MKIAQQIQVALFFVLPALIKTTFAQGDMSTTKVGGYGGSDFPMWSPQTGSTIQLRTGSHVDAIVLDGVRRGGGGGRASPTITLERDEYINSFEIRGASQVDKIQFTTNKGKRIGGGGTGGRRIFRNNIRVLGISGRSGSSLDQITIHWVPEFTNTVQTEVFGGSGGTAFEEQGVHSLSLKGGTFVDSITINDKKFGGNGGGRADELNLGSNEYISSFTVRHARLVDFVSFTKKSTTSSRTDFIQAGGAGGTIEETFNNVRVISIGGRSGSKIDQLRITFLENYVPSSAELESVTMVMGARGEGTFVEFNSRNVLTTESVLETSSFAIEASVEKEFFGTANAALSTSFTSTRDVERTLETQIEESTETTFEVGPGQALWEITVGTIMTSAEGQMWILPQRADPRFDLVDESQLSSFLANGKKIIDLGGFMLSVTGHENVAQLDSTFASAGFDVYEAKEQRKNIRARA